ncbi:MAG: diaminopimelate epimerase, partial [Cyclobacteriaceae bacterium]
MKLSFYKYQAAGNDFVCFDNRQGEVKLTTEQIGRICDRRFGVGADGIIYVERDANYDFYVRYFNADGTQSLCGNGSRSAVDLAAHLKLVAGKTVFNAYDGPHEATVISPGLIRMQIHDVKH